MVREGRVLISVATDPDFGANYSVTACKIGAQVATGSSGNTVAVRAGHGFAAADKFIVGTSTTQFKTILSVTSTVLTLSVATTVTVSAGDLLVNLAADTGASTPNYDGAGLTVYTDMAYASVATNNTVTADSNGRYRYYHKGIGIWELVRTGTSPIAVYTDVSGGVGKNSWVNGSGTGVFVHPGTQSGDFPAEFTQAFDFGITLNKVGATSGALALNVARDGLLR